MTALNQVIENSPNGVAIADGPRALSKITDPGCHAAIWRRQPLDVFQSWLDALPTSVLPHTRLILRPSAVRDAIEHICEVCGTPKGAECDMLIDDIAALSHIFSHVMDASYLRVRLDVVTTNACRKFHVDAVTTRLICTYRGPGTQYGSASDGQEPRHIFTVPTCAPVMLRGSLAPGHSSPQILHRSPPIDGTAMSRLVLVLDPVEDEDDVADMPPSITRH